MKKLMVISHERSGTHFLIDSICANVEIYDNSVINVYTESDYDNIDEYREKVCGHLYGFFGKPVQRVFKSHHQAHFFKDIIDELKKEFHIFYIYRNPLDTLTSLYHYYKDISHPNFDDNVDNFLFRIFPKDPWYTAIQDKDNVERLKNHVLNWKKMGVNLIKYEDMLLNYNETMNNIFTILELPQRGEYEKSLLGAGSAVSPRKGVVNDHVNLFNQEQIDKLTQYFNE